MDPTAALPSVDHSAPETEQLGIRLKQVMDAGKGVRSGFLTTGNEINQYAYSTDFKFVYQDWNEDDTSAFRARISKAAEYVEIIGPYLYQNNPVYEVTPKKFAYPECIARNGWEAQYLDWAAKEQDLYTQAMRCTNESLVYGRGVMWTGYDTRKKCVSHSYDNVSNLIIDPDAQCLGDANIKFRVRLKPRYELIQLFPEQEAMIRDLPKATDLPSHLKSGNNPVSDLIQYVEAYARVGVSRWLPLSAQTEDDSPTKVTMTMDGKIIAQGPWEIPFWRDDLWPCTELDFRELPGQVWPAAPLQPALCWIKALNWMTTLYIRKSMFTTKTPLVTVERNGSGFEKDQLAKLIYGGAIETLKLTINGSEPWKIDDFLKLLELPSGVEDLERYLGIMTRNFEDASGLTQFLTTGGSETQSRTAEDVKSKDQKSQTRIKHMVVQEEKFMTTLGRKARIAARYLEAPEDIAALFGPQAGQEWGYLASPEEVQQQRQMQQEAEQMNQQIAELGPQMQAIGATPPPPRPVPPVAAIDFDNWIRESDVTVEAGSMKRLDHDQRIDAANDSMNQPFSALMSIGQTIPALQLMANWMEVNDLPAEAQASIQKAIANIKATPLPTSPLPPGAPTAPQPPQV